MIADLTLFDPATVIDGSTVQDPEAPPKGIEAVFVSGEVVVENNKPTGAHPGKVLRHVVGKQEGGGAELPKIRPEDSSRVSQACVKAASSLPAACRPPHSKIRNVVGSRGI